MVAETKNKTKDIIKWLQNRAPGPSDLLNSPGAQESERESIEFHMGSGYSKLGQ